MMAIHLGKKKIVIVSVNDIRPGRERQAVAYLGWLAPVIRSQTPKSHHWEGGVYLYCEMKTADLKISFLIS